MRHGARRACAALLQTPVRAGVRPATPARIRAWVARAGREAHAPAGCVLDEPVAQARPRPAIPLYIHAEHLAMLGEGSAQVQLVDLFGEVANEEGGLVQLRLSVICVAARLSIARARA